MNPKCGATRALNCTMQLIPILRTSSWLAPGCCPMKRAFWTAMGRSSQPSLSESVTITSSSKPSSHPSSYPSSPELPSQLLSQLLSSPSFHAVGEPFLYFERYTSNWLPSCTPSSDPLSFCTAPLVLPRHRLHHRFLAIVPS